MMTTNLFVIVNVKQLRTGGSFRILLPFSLTSWRVGVLNSATFKLIRMLKWNTKHFPPNLQSGLTLSNFRYVGGGFEHPKHPPLGTLLSTATFVNTDKVYTTTATQ